MHCMLQHYEHIEGNMFLIPFIAFLTSITTYFAFRVWFHSSNIWTIFTNGLNYYWIRNTITWYHYHTFKIIKNESMFWCITLWSWYRPHKTFVKVFFFIIMIHYLTVFTKTFSTCMLIQIDYICFVIVQFNFAIGTKKHFFTERPISIFLSMMFI